MSDAPAFLAPENAEINPAPGIDAPLEPGNGESRSQLNPDRYLSKAKALVMANYNASHDPSRTPPLQLDQIYIVWFTKVFKGWKSVLGSSEVRNLMWQVSYSKPADEYYIEIYRRINSAKVKGDR